MDTRTLSTVALQRKEFWVPRAKPHYPPQFKAEAVQLVRSSGRSISQIAKDLGVSANSLRNWVKQAQIDQGEREGLTTEEREELRRLRRENKVLKQERGDLLEAELISLIRRLPPAAKGESSR